MPDLFGLALSLCLAVLFGVVFGHALVGML